MISKIHIEALKSIQEMTLDCLAVFMSWMMVSFWSKGARKRLARETTLTLFSMVGLGR